MTETAQAKDLLVQTAQPAMEDLGLVSAHKKLVESVTQWTQVALLTDEGNKNLIVLLINESRAISSLRFCLDVDESVQAVEMLAPTPDEIYLSYLQGRELTVGEVKSLTLLDALWQSVGDQTAELTGPALRIFFEKLVNGAEETGRGADISVETKRKVLQFSHGRCMFEGCGADLGIEELTGYEGNFGYLAHNVGSSEHAARGGTGISRALSNDPNNILLLCDKHHRLIDKIAAVDFPAHRLSEMRSRFKHVADRLLEGLGYEVLPCYAVLWPVGGNVIASPSELQIAQALSVMKSRMDGYLNIMTENNDLLVASAPEQAWRILPEQISVMASKILQQTHQQQHTAALFAFGLMPALIGLGASLGNKAGIIPMLRFRDSGTWTWPLETARSQTINITFDDELSDEDDEVAVVVSMTARPEPFQTFLQSSGLKQVEISAVEGNLGNGCISHPEEGKQLMKLVHELFHTLVTDYGIKRIHLLPCASNAACVFLGKAIDNYHPEIVVYDFDGPKVVPRLAIEPVSNGVKLAQVDRPAD
ncbi:MAG: SAVED domain-containing protein [Pseudomonadota bacterium]